MILFGSNFLHLLEVVLFRRGGLLSMAAVLQMILHLISSDAVP